MNMSKRMASAGSILLLGIGLAGCSADLDEVQGWMDKTRADTPRRVGKIDEPKSFVPFRYEARLDYDPFSSSKLMVAAANLTDRSKSGLSPDLNRRREPLESFPIDTIRLVGPAEVAGLAPPGVVDDLVGHHQRAGLQVVTDAADHRAGHQGRGTGLAQRPDVGPVIDVVRRDGVAIAVPGDEHHRLGAQSAEGQRAGRLPPGGARHLALAALQVDELAQPAATDDA